MKITGLILWVQENNLSAKFYKKLGFDVVRADDDHTVVSLKGFEVTLVSMRDEDKFSKDSMSSNKGRGMHIYVHVDDVDVKHQELVTKGIKPATRPKDWEWGSREFIIKDPDGYKLCFWQQIK